MGPIPARYFWPGLCVAFLSLSVGTGVVAIMAANSDGGAEIVDEESSNRQLVDRADGPWQIEVSLEQARTGTGRVPVELGVRDEDGEPVDGLEGQVELRSPAEAGVVDEAQIAPVDGRTGRYRVDLAFERDGLWDFVVEVRGGDETMTTRIREAI